MFRWSLIKVWLVQRRKLNFFFLIKIGGLAPEHRKSLPTIFIFEEKQEYDFVVLFLLCYVSFNREQDLSLSSSV